MAAAAEQPVPWQIAPVQPFGEYPLSPKLSAREHQSDQGSRRSSGKSCGKRAKETRGVAPPAAGCVVGGNDVMGSCWLTFHGTHSALSGRGDPDLGRGRRVSRCEDALCAQSANVADTQGCWGLGAARGVAARRSMAMTRTPMSQNPLDFPSSPCSSVRTHLAVITCYVPTKAWGVGSPEIQDVPE